MKLRSQPSSPGLAGDPPDIELLLAHALVPREPGRPADNAAPNGAPTDEQRARARTLLHDFAMRHFSSQVETIRRDAVIQRLRDDARERLRFRRLVIASLVGTLLGSALIEAISAHWLAAEANDVLVRLIATAADRLRV